MFLLIPAHLCCPGQNPESHKTVVCVKYNMILIKFDTNKTYDNISGLTVNKTLVVW